MRKRLGLTSVLPLLLILGFTVAGLTNTQRIQAQWDDWAQPEARTDLYFTDEATLPARYVPGQQQTFSFAFVNRERHLVKYHFEVVATDQKGARKVVGTGQAEAPHNKIGTVSPVFTIPDMGERVEITVELIYELPESGQQHKQIDFWQERTVPSTTSLGA